MSGAGTSEKEQPACGARAVLLAAAAAIGFSLTGNAAELGINGKPGPGMTTLEAALIEAYQNNPQLNAQRAATRAIDENVPTALSGYSPRVTGTGSLTEQYLDTTTRSPALGTTIISPPTALPAFPTYTRNYGNAAVSSAGSPSVSGGILFSAMGPWVSSPQLTATSRTTSAKLMLTMTK